MAVSILGTPALTEGVSIPSNYSVGAGDNRKLLVLTTLTGSGDTMDSLTFGTQSMNLVHATSQDSANAKAYAWELNEAGIAAASSTAFVGEYTGSPASTQMAHHVIVLQDVDQTADAQAENSDVSTDNRTDETISGSIAGATDAYGIALAKMYQSVTTQTWTWSNSWVEQQYTSTIVNFSSLAAKALSSGTDNFSATASNAWASRNILMVLRFDPAASGTSIPIFSHHYTKNLA